jgi:hypothetical protein
MKIYLDDPRFDRNDDNTITGTLRVFTPTGNGRSYVQVDTFNIPVDKIEIEGDVSDLVGKRVTVRLRAFVTASGQIAPALFVRSSLSEPVAADAEQEMTQCAKQ